VAGRRERAQPWVSTLLRLGSIRSSTARWPSCRPGGADGTPLPVRTPEALRAAVEQARTSDWTEIPQENDMLTSDQLSTVVATAVAAPSVHNTQPWLFDLAPERVDVIADAGRALAHQDPAGRELLISCGAASLHAELAVRGLGHACTVQVLPVAERPELVARIEVGGPVPVTEQEQRLLDAVPRRHTERNPFADWPVPVSLLDDLGAAADVEGLWLQVLTTVDVLELALLQAQAQGALLEDDEALRERASWARTGPAPDGLPADQVPGWPAGRPAPGVVRAGPDTVPDVVLVLGSATDDRTSWVRAGRALARVLLEATACGLVAAPATLPLELPTVRTTLVSTLALRGIPQMVLRVGYPAGLAAERTGRRPVDEVVVGEQGADAGDGERQVTEDRRREDADLSSTG
jgi:nitroreductase